MENEPNAAEESAYEFAKRALSGGYDFTYIELQLAEAKIPDEIIDREIVRIKKLDLSLQRIAGRRKIFMGLSFIAVSIFFTWFSTNVWNFEYGYILYGGAVWGVIQFAKGVTMLW